MPHCPTDFYIVVAKRDALPSVPRGVKSNAYFAIYNKENVKRVDNNEFCVYHNDCGAWDGPNSGTVDIIYAVCNRLEKRESSIAIKASTRINT